MIDIKKEIEFEDFNKGSRQTSVFIPSDLWILAKQNLIEFKSAMLFGLRFLIAEKDGFGYPDNKLSLKIISLSKIIQEKNEEIERLQKEIPKVDIKQIEKEAEDILKNIGAE